MKTIIDGSTMTHAEAKIGADAAQCIMPPSKTDYGRTDLVNGLRLTGLCAGDVVFFQLSHLTLGSVACVSSEQEMCEIGRAHV